MAEHTPERWDLGPYVDGRYRIITPTDVPFEARVVADVATLADARKIAVTPQLIAACEAVIEQSQRATSDLWQDIGDCYLVDVDVIDQLRAAIAKARGERHAE